MEPNKNCRGCGALLTKLTCIYCGRKITQGDKVTLDPKDDPKKKIRPRIIRK